jgi:hypothetical protein
MELKIPKRLQKAKAELQPRPKGKIAASSKGAKFVLFLGDEGAILVHLKSNAVQSRQFVPDASEHNLNELRQTLSKDTHAPLMLVVDSMDQSFMQQTLPPVSVVSVNKLIRRRLERDFAGNDIKGAILLGREKTGRRDWNFLMVALEKSPQLAVWLNFIQELPNRFLGVFLASVESEVLVKKLERAMGVAAGEDEAEWKFFVSHNKVGGFRQVIMRNGRIIFTRLAQPIGDSNAEVIAGGIEQEMLSTIEYMKRLSFSPQSKLDIYIITSGNIKAVIDRSKFSANAFHILTPYEVAGYLGIEGAAQPTDQFGDVVMAVAIGLSKKHVLRLSAPQTRRVDQCYQFITYQRLLVTMAVLGLLGYAGYVGYGIYGLASDNADLTQKRDTMQNNLGRLRQDIKDSKLDVEKASDLIDLYQQIGREKTSPLPFLRKFEVLQRAPVWIKALDWSFSTADGKTIKQAGGTAPAPVPVGNTGQLSIIAVVTLEFPQEASDPKMFRALTKKILADFKEQFAGYDVNYSVLPDEAKENEKLEIRSGKTQEIAVKSLEAQMTIKGPLRMEEVSQIIKPTIPEITVPAVPAP